MCIDMETAKGNKTFQMSTLIKSRNFVTSWESRPSGDGDRREKLSGMKRCYSHGATAWITGTSRYEDLTKIVKVPLLSHGDNIIHDPVF
jgi:hypothetical protein